MYIPALCAANKVLKGAFTTSSTGDKLLFASKSSKSFSSVVRTQWNKKCHIRRTQVYATEIFETNGVSPKKVAKYLSTFDFIKSLTSVLGGKTGRFLTRKVFSDTVDMG